MRHFGEFSNIMEVLETLEKLGKQIVVKWFWELWKACSKVNICCPTRCLWYLPWRWGLRWKFGVVFWYWSPLDTSSGKWGQPFRHLYTKTIWRPVNYCAKYKWRWRNRQYCTGVVLRGSRDHHPASLKPWENWNSFAVEKCTFQLIREFHSY